MAYHAWINNLTSTQRLPPNSHRRIRGREQVLRHGLLEGRRGAQQPPRHLCDNDNKCESFSFARRVLLISLVVSVRAKAQTRRHRSMAFLLPGLGVASA